MKIAYILNTYPQPSQSFIRREIQALEAQGHEVLRFAMRRSDTPLVDVQDRAEADKTEYVLAEGKGTLVTAALQALKADPAKLYEAAKAAIAMGRASETSVLRHLVYLTEAAFVAARCRAEGVVHAHAHFGTNAAAVAMLASMLSGPKFSFTVHGPEEFDAPRALSLGTKMHHAAFTVGISQFGRSQLCRWADPDDWDRIAVVRCGIEPEKFSTPAPLPDGPRRLVAIGRLVEQKGQLALVRAMGETEEDMHLTLIGDGEMRPQIESLIAKLGLAERITLTGWVDENRIKAELDAAHALVMPSFAEGLPMVVMEAMAAARPVIATYIAGTPELVQEGKSGWMVPAGDVHALAAALDRMAATPLSNFRKMGDAARSRVLERHDVHKEAEKLAQLMRE
ncbi:Glycosyl transferase, group 1 family protein [Sulfitobacter noctilucae]|uniref:glycosyltransferase family 4 protein n=1 Tax=Sulfitobacter noctilucae TaxID=1342302 RepID=UPI00055DC3AD|nr:glycosyltransferase family 4 protein [Sulfitobacter noctilucae]KIN61596.1 Glycosyl transferase, group 1 family protein [Sulfitobacter noctilucae]